MYIHCDVPSKSRLNSNNVSPFQDSIAIPTPAGLLPVEAVSPVIVMPNEVDLTPVAPAPVPAPVEVAPVPAAVADAASPLVQIIVNIKSQESAVSDILLKL